MNGREGIGAITNRRVGGAAGDSRRCFEGYEELAAASLEQLAVPEARRHARSVVALMMGFGLRRLGGGDEDPAGTAAALSKIVRCAGAGA